MPARGGKQTLEQLRGEQAGLEKLVRDLKSSQRLFRLRPDIVVRKDGASLCIVDTKWKRLSPEERKLGISQGALYQMLAYAEGYAGSAVLLIYPWDHPDADDRDDGGAGVEG